MPYEVNINPNEPMNIRNEIKRCAMLMEVKLQMHRDRDETADLSGVRRVLQMTPDDWGPRMAQVLTDGIQRNLARITSSADPFDVAHVSDAIDIMNYAMMICTTAWNGEGAGFRQEVQNEQTNVTFPTAGGIGWEEVTHVGIYDANQLPDVTNLVQPGQFMENEEQHVVLREDFWETTGISEDETVIINGREFIINADGRSARPNNAPVSPVAEEQPTVAERAEDPIF